DKLLSSTIGANSNGFGAPSLWRVLTEIPKSIPSVSKRGMKLKTPAGIDPQQWLSHCCPFAEDCPNNVLPANEISGRLNAKALSTKKYSCSHPIVAFTLTTFLSKYFATAVAALSTDCKARNNGVL